MSLSNDWNDFQRAKSAADTFLASPPERCSTPSPNHYNLRSTLGNSEKHVFGGENIPRASHIPRSTTPGPGSYRHTDSKLDPTVISKSGSSPHFGKEMRSHFSRRYPGGEVFQKAFAASASPGPAAYSSQTNTGYAVPAFSFGSTKETVSKKRAVTVIFHILS